MKLEIRLRRLESRHEIPNEPEELTMTDEERIRRVDELRERAPYDPDAQRRVEGIDAIIDHERRRTQMAAGNSRFPHGTEWEA